ncbi:hypothetical protein MD484_g8162, partial [Candolleomyces efflorescens]
MPMVPSVNQIFAANGAVPPSAQQQQSSPTMASGTIPPRTLPIPPDQVPLPSPEPRSSPPSSQTYPGPQSGVNPHFPRPVRAPPSFLRHFTDAEVDDLKITEVMADIERVELQQQPSSNTYPTSYGPGLRSDTPSQKDPIERVRAMERASPSNLDLQSRRQREPARESPKARDRQPTSPSNTGFIQQNQHSGAPTPERRLSPKPSHIATNDQQAQHSQNIIYGRDYATRDSPGVPRRAGNIGTDPRSSLSYNNQTPPLQSSVARTPDKTLPLQEEAEDEFGPSSKGPWKETGLGALDRISSPTPSSDLNPDGNSQRYDRHNGRGDPLNGRGIEENAPQSKASDSTNRYSDKDGEDSGSYTPRSPTANLPDHRSHEKYYQHPNQRTSPKVSSRVKSRNGSIDGLGLRTIDPSAFEANAPSSAAPSTTPSERSSYIDHRQQQDNQYAPPKQVYQPQTQTQAPNPNPSYSNYSQGLAPRSPQASHRTFSERQAPPPPASVPPQPNYPKNGYYDQAQVYPDDFQNYSEDPASFSYLHAYLASPRPDAPIPPTPHSQSAAPSPSPFPNGYGGKAMPYSPIAPVGSPYPYPFTHVRRNPPAPTGFSQYSSNYDPNHPAAIQEQLAKQWQIYLQNQANGNMTDSTFSPAATPFQGANYNPYAFLHTARLTRQQRDTMSLHSSPSHEPIPLPMGPRTGRKKDLSKDLRHQMASRRRPPPRVDSTQPRDTSPEPSSSGEETAGEYPPTTTSTQPTSRESSMTNGERGGKSLSPLNGGELWKTTSTSSSAAGEKGEGKDEVEAEDDEDEDWIDEDEEADDSDLLDFEYHPNYVANTDKRRRRWEVGWEALVQSFQKLDRQTDTTMVVLAAPPHSNKLYSIRSRSIRRAPVLRNSATIRDIRSSFKRLAKQRKNIRPVKPQSLAEKLLESSSVTGDGSDGSNESRAEDLRKALEMALGSLNVLNGMYERRESRWQEEMKKMQHDKEQVSFYLNQVLGIASSQQPALQAPAYPQPLPPFPMAMTMPGALPGAGGPPYSAFPPLPSSSLSMVQQPVPSVKEPSSAKTM